MIHKKRSRKLVIGALAVAILSLTSCVFVYASYFGRDEGEGYFKGNNESGDWGKDWNVIRNGIKKSDSKNADDLIDFLKDKNKHGSTQDSVGAAFIANTMLGYKAPGHGKTVSKDDWDQLWKNLFALYLEGHVTWSTYSPCYNDSSYYQTDNKDDAFYELTKKLAYEHLGFGSDTSIPLTTSQKKKLKSFCGDHDVLQFKDNGKVIYRLDKDCANPIGTTKPLPTAKEWYITASSSSNIGTAAPGQTIVWTHKLKNEGPDKTTKTIHSNLSISGFSNGWNGTRADGDTGSGKSEGTIRTITDYATYMVTQNDVGNNLCEKVQYDPTDWMGNRNGSGSNICVSVPYNYSLDPQIGNIADVIDPDTQTPIPTVVTNSGPTKSRGTSWAITQVILFPNKPKPNEGGGNSGQDPCPTYFSPPFADGQCTVIASGVNKVFSANGVRPDGTPYPPTTDNSISGVGSVGDLEVGTKICYALSVKDRSSGASEWRHSPLKCMTVGKKPKIQIWGADLSARGLVQTSTSDKNIGGNQRFGSWGEYGIFAVNSINGMGSGSAFAGIPSAPGLAFNLFSDSACKYSTLSFANVRVGGANCTDSPVTIGHYSNLRSIPDVAASFPGAGAPISGTVIPNDLPKNLPDSITDIYNAVDITLGGSTLAPGKSIIIKATGTVTINGDQKYSNGPYINILQLPQLVIIANKIVINNNVTNVDAWLVAKNNSNTGEIDTCEVVGNTSNICNAQLTVNGPVMANKLYLRRTFGSGTGVASGDPAEVFNLRADAYMWATARAISGGHIQTVYTTELPPRF